MRLFNGSGVSREVPAPFCEGLAGKFRWATLLKQSKVRETQKQDHEQDGQLVDDGTMIALENPLNCLYQITARHINFMFIVVKGLKSLSSELREEIVLEF